MNAVLHFKSSVQYKLFDLQVDKVYYISKGQLKPANKQFSNIPNDYEMTLTNETTIQECTEDLADVPTVKYEFVPIKEIADKPPNAIVGEFKHVIFIQWLLYLAKKKILSSIIYVIAIVNNGIICTELCQSQWLKFIH